MTLASKTILLLESVSPLKCAIPNNTVSITRALNLANKHKISLQKECTTDGYIYYTLIGDIENKLSFMDEL